MNIILISILAGIVLLILLTFIKKDSQYANFGVNLKRIFCPNCNLKQPVLRKPANERQAMYGGYTCKNCGTEMDKYGTEINS